MARRDYYAILAVDRRADVEEIKKSFRALAKRYHPDRNPDDLDADRRFREVVEAWDVLGDPEQRTRYDRLGPFYRPDGRPPSPDDIQAVVGDALASIFRRRPPPERGEDLRYALTITLEQAALGTESSIQLSRMARCRRCKGSGAEPDGGTRVCDQCKGDGKTSKGRLLRGKCPRCDGRGFVVVQRCKKCRGKGRRSRTDTLKLRVPAGVATGQKLKIQGKGNVPRRGRGKPGDLFVLIEVAQHALFRRRGQDLFCEVPITVTEAALGAEIRVPTLDGSTTIRVPAGTPSGQILRLAGRGLQRVSGKGRGRRGDIHYKVIIEVPTELTDDARAVLHDLSQRLGTDAYPLRQAYTEQIKERS
ncbi:MAG: molecular chaperone DnaJ [Oligoflexia bacterium]|nr:molecular chaperone DnaJ [Oligoflexia bacterium]